MTAITTAGAQAQLPPDSLRLMIERNDARVVATVRAFPDTARALIAHLLAESAAASDDTAPLATAHALAAAYAIAWNDSFFVRNVTRFEAWTPAQRLTKAMVDSLRLAGGTTLSSSGAAAAKRTWRESHRLARSIGDSAGQASALGNIAVAFYREGALDSAESYLNRSRALAERIGDHRTRLNAMGTLATVAKGRGDGTRAEALYVRTLSLRALIGDDRGAASDENNLGLLAVARGDTAAARRAYEAARARNLRAGRVSIASDNVVNLANLAVLRGDYADADSAYNEALATRRDGGETAREAPVLHNIGLLALRRGDFAAARDALRRAIAIFDETGPDADAIMARTDLAQAEGAMGDLEAALATLRRADSIARNASTPDMLAFVALARADLAVEFNAYADAERGYVAAAEFFAQVDDAASQADAQQGLGVVLLRRGNAAAARRAFDRALRALSTTRDRHARAMTQLLIGHSLAALNDTAAARRQFEVALAALRAVNDPVGEASAIGALAALRLEAGDARGAELQYDRALARLNARIAPSITLELRTGRALALASRGALAAAASELRTVIEQSERVAGALQLPERRAGYRADKWMIYERLALLERRRGRDAEAFAVSERLRGRQLLELLANGRVPSSTKATEQFVAQEQDLRHRISAMERALEVEQGRDRIRGLSFRADAEGASRTALESAQREYSELLAFSRERVGDYADVVRPVIADARTVGAGLQAHEAILEYLVSDSTTIVFVVRRDRVQSVDLGISRRALAAAVDFTRETIAGGARTTQDAPWRSPLQRLHQVLIEPIEREGVLRGIRTLLIAPHAELHYLPFAALLEREGPSRFLVERYTIAYIPSASLWLKLVERSGGPKSSSVLAMAPRPDALPASRNEVAAIRAVYGRNATVLIGSTATESALQSRASNASIIHFATYGVLNKHNPLFSFVELASDSSDDGHLAVHEVFGMSLRARLVVLSACQTALASGASADVPAGDDWIGLVRAFLLAGADNVLATLWPVLDRSSAVVMGDFYRELSNQTLPEALALAQRKAIRESTTSDPIHWAAYSLVGSTK